MLPPYLEEALGFNVYRTAQLFRRELIIALKEYRLTPEQWQILIALWTSSDELTQQEISYLTLKEKQTVSRIVQRLERDGWITKKISKDDARAFIVKLTPKAKRLNKVIPEKLVAHFKPKNPLSADEEKMLMTLLKKLRHTLERPME
jgi:DNA-binding MarR family transcriptional regulator